VVVTQTSKILTPADAQAGDIIMFKPDPANPKAAKRGLYLGGNQVIVEPKDGEVVQVTTLDWGQEESILRPNAGGTVNGPGVAGAAPNSPVANISNDKLVQFATTFEQLAGGHVGYAGPGRPHGFAQNAGNFGHGNKQLWLTRARASASERALDCSGFINMLLWLAYGVDYGGCSASFVNLKLNGTQVTVPIMRTNVIAAQLHPGDLIIENHTCGVDGHIVMVLSVSGNTVNIAQSSGGQGYNVTKRDASWFGSNWHDFTVSRWIGPGAYVNATGLV